MVNTTDTVPGSLAPNAGGTVTGGVSTVVDQGVNGSLHSPLPSCKFGDKIPPNVDTNDATSVDWSVIGVPGRQDCIARWKTTNPGSSQLSALEFQVNGIEAGTVVATNPSTGGSCYKADAARALQLKERERLTANGQSLSPKAAELDGAANDYWDLKQIAENLFDPIFGDGTVCRAIDAGLRLANLMNIDG